MILVLKSSIFSQVKVWFQNRRTKYKRDRSRDHESADSKSESLATCNILRLLQNQVPRPTCTSYLPPYPYGFSGFSASWYFFFIKVETVVYSDRCKSQLIVHICILSVNLMSCFDTCFCYLYVHIIIWFIICNTKKE